MNTLERLEAGFLEARSRGDDEKARLIGQEIRRLQGTQVNQPEQAPAPERTGPGGFAAFAAAGVPRAVASGVDLTNQMMGNVRKFSGDVGQMMRGMAEGGGLRESLGRFLDAQGQPAQAYTERPLLGSEQMPQAMASIGVPIPSRGPETMPEYIGDFAGDTMASLPVFLRGAQTLQASKGIAGSLAKATMREITERPVRSLLVEGAATVGGGTGRMIAEQNELGPFSQAILELSGAAGAGGFVSLSPTYAGIQTLRRTGGKAIFPFTEEGSFLRASKRLKEVVPDADKAARQIEDLKGSALMPSAATGEPGLMALEATVLKADPARAAGISQRNADTVADLVGQIRQSGNIQDTRKFISAKRERLNKALDARIEQAGDEAANAVTALGADPSSGPANASVVVRNALEEALADAKVQEAMLWQAIPQDAKVPVAGLVKKYGELRKGLSSSQLEDMPIYVTRAVGIIREKKVLKTTIRELDGLYKKLGEVSTAARAAGERNKARIADEFRDFIWQSLEKAEGGPAVRESIDTARSFSRSMHEKFSRGSVGRVLGYSREGGDLVAPEASLDVVLGPGRKGMLGVRRLQEATDNPLVLEGVQDYLKAQFTRNAVVDGRVSPQKAESFFRQNAEMLDALPGLKQQLSAARSAEDVARRVQNNADTWRKALDRPEVSSAARFLQAPVDQEVNRIMTSTDPERYFKQIKAMALRQRNGEALSGLKSGVSEWLIRSATSADSIDIAGRPMFNGMKLRRIMQEPRVANALKTIYAPHELKNILELAELTAKIQRQNIGAPGIPLIEDFPSKLIEIPGRILGAKIGAKMSSTAGGSIQAANIGSKTVADFLRKLTADKATQLLTDAIDNPDLMIALLRHNANAPAVKRAAYERSIRAYLAGAGARLIDEETKQLLADEQRERRGR
jgi:hypothetical protein